MIQHSISELLDRARQGDSVALGELLNGHRDRLLRLIDLRMDDRLRGRVSPSDVIQEASLEAACRFPDYFRNSEMPFYVWLRFLAAQKLAEVHRRHFHVKARDRSRDVPLFSGLSEASSALLAGQLLGKTTGPSQAAVQAERHCQLMQALDSMEASDREIIVLRHFEQLSNSETAAALSMNESTVSTRHVRALKRLRQILSTMPDFQDMKLGTDDR